MSTITGERAIDAYVTAVRAALGPDRLDQHHELVEDLVEHLEELAAEEGGTLAERLGPPGAYAAELLASAGIEEHPVAAIGSSRLGRGRERVHVRAEQLRDLIGPERMALVRPVWWALRGWGAVALVSALVNDSYIDPVPDIVNNRLVDLVLLAAGVVASVWVAHRGGRRDTLFTIVAVLGLLAAVLQGEGGGGDLRYVTSSPYDGVLTRADGRPITNLWPFAADGTPLEDVFLFDQTGAPIDVGPLGPSADFAIPGRYPQHDEPSRRGVPRDGRPDVDVPGATSTTVPPTTAPGG